MSFADLPQRDLGQQVPLTALAPLLPPVVVALVGGPVSGEMALHRQGRSLAPALRIRTNDAQLAKRGIDGSVRDDVLALLFGAALRHAAAAAKAQRLTLAEAWTLHGTAARVGANRYLRAIRQDALEARQRRADQIVADAEAAERRAARARRPPPPSTEAEQEAQLVASTRALLQQYAPRR